MREVTIDGTRKGKIGQPISLPAGQQHSISVGSAGLARRRSRHHHRRSWQAADRTRSIWWARPSRVALAMSIIMLTPMPGAQYFVNGRLIDESAVKWIRRRDRAGHVVVAGAEGRLWPGQREVNLRPGTTGSCRV